MAKPVALSRPRKVHSSAESGYFICGTCSEEAAGTMLEGDDPRTDHVPARVAISLK